MVALNVTKWRYDVAEQIITLTQRYYSGSSWAQYTSDADEVQTSFFSLGGGDAKNWTASMRDVTAQARKDIPEDHYASFVAAGQAHCRSQDNGFFEVQSDKHKLSDWLTGLVTGEKIEKNVDCHADGEARCKAKSSDQSQPTANATVDGTSERAKAEHAAVELMHRAAQLL